MLNLSHFRPMFNEMPRPINMLVRFCGKITCVLFPLVFLITAHTLPAAQETNGLPLFSDTVITNMAGLWRLSPAEKSRSHPIRMELLMYYCDTNWNVFWGRSDGLDTFIPLRGIPVALKTGEKIAIDGQIIPVNEEFLWERTSVKFFLNPTKSNPFPPEGGFLTLRVSTNILWGWKLWLIRNRGLRIRRRLIQCMF